MLPAAVRAQTHIGEGGELIASAQEGRVILETAAAIKARLRAAASAARADGRVVDGLLADRKADLDLETRMPKSASRRTLSP